MADGPVAVVTGASAGVGRAVARALADRGFDLGLLARGRAGLEGAARDVEARGRRAVAVSVDVADWDRVDAAATAVEEALGPIEVWVNDAMTTVFSPFAQIAAEDYRRATEVTYLGQVHGTMAALARMRPRDRGCVVNVSSALSFVGIPLQSAYCGAKFAVRGFTQSVQAELAHEGSAVRIALVHLPAVNTPQFEWCQSALPNQPQPVPPVYRPEVAARAILAALDRRRSRTLGSWNRIIVAGSRLAPGLVHRYATRTGHASQQADEPVEAGRPSNLFHPVDERTDHGAHGPFGDRAGGATDPSFLKALPRTAADLGRSALEALRARGDRPSTRSQPERSRP